MNAKKRRDFFIKLAVSMAMLAVLIGMSDINDMVETVSSMRLDMLAYAVVMLLIIRVIMVIRWKVLLAYYHVDVSFSSLLTILFISNSVGYFLPGGIGGDVVRIYDLARTHGNADKITASVFIDRVVGVVSMLLVAMVSGWTAYSRGDIDMSVPLITSLLVIMLIFVYMSRNILTAVDLPVLTGSRMLARMISFYNKFIAAVRQSNISVFSYLYLLVVSVAVQLLRCLVFVCIFLGLGESVGLQYFFIYIPIVLIATLLPMSVGGLGVREAVLYMLFSTAGVSLEASTAAGLIFYSLQLLLVLPGIIMILLRK